MHSIVSLTANDGCPLMPASFSLSHRFNTQKLHEDSPSKVPIFSCSHGERANRRTDYLTSFLVTIFSQATENRRTSKRRVEMSLSS